ncbi:IQ calmodulin-binding motif-containing protein 1 isoform X2 [Hyla sarda]|uniref:IQ calmodulin-binding motif-containing protein 1 isoform X2 n=1 Tax=Hyla sarda TaxID=327740 RepID=UPI0024C32FB6|nr:IQ calmodulin-binding motif-containing protein 1 isoform X2 [Hyla sarda]
MCLVRKMSAGAAHNPDRRILELASKLTESSHDSDPVLLLTLRDILQSAAPGSKSLQNLKEDSYSYGLVQYCVLVLKQDYSRVDGRWTTAAALADVLSKCCVGLDPKNDADEFYSKLLPSAAVNMLVLGRRIQARYVRSVKDEKSGELLRCFRLVMDSLCWLFSGHVQLVELVWRQEHFLQLLMTDDVESGTAVMSVLQAILRANSSVLHQIPEETLHPILDELVYKLSASSNPVTGSSATRSLLLMVESNPQLVRIVGTRYKGLRSLLSKQWTGKGFGRELSRLLDILYSSTYQQEELQRLHRAACVIQAVWRGFRIRRRIRKLPGAVTSLQRSFRSKRDQEMKQQKRQREEEDLRERMKLQRLRAMREFREKQLTLLEIVHAGQMDKHIQETQERSAMMIQKLWRGYRERRQFLRQKQILKQYKAAVIIQRAAMRLLKKRRLIRESLSPWKKHQDLPDEEKLRLQQKVDARLQLHPAQQMSLEQSQDLHKKVQDRLGQFLLTRKQQQRCEQRREALLAHINTDIGMLMGAPSLKDATEKDVDLFTSRSVPVALKAKQCHSTMLKRSRWPWWKKLSDEFVEENDSIRGDIPDLEHGIIFMAGSKQP